MTNFKANERTFQDVLLSIFNKIIDDNPTIKFDSAFQEQNVGIGENRFSDTIINSSVDSSKKFFIELKNAKAVDSNFFNAYNVYFTEDSKQTTISFNSSCQLKLFKFFYDNLEIKGQKIMLPSNSEDCEKIYTILSSDFKNYSSQIKSVLKSLRSSASHLAVYRELMLN